MQPGLRGAAALLENSRKPQGLGDILGSWQPQGGTTWLPWEEELPGRPQECASGKKQDKPLVPCSSSPSPQQTKQGTCVLAVPGTGKECSRPPLPPWLGLTHIHLPR